MGVMEDVNRGIGQKNVQVWVDPDLHAAFKEKLSRDRRTMRDVITRMIIAYTGFKKKEDVPQEKQ